MSDVLRHYKRDSIFPLSQLKTRTPRSSALNFRDDHFLGNFLEFIHYVEQLSFSCLLFARFFKIRLFE